MSEAGAEPLEEGVYWQFACDVETWHRADDNCECWCAWCVNHCQECLCASFDEDECGRIYRNGPLAGA
jgi:hypothetical protein